MKKGKGIGLYQIIDLEISQELGVDVEDYIRIIDHKCTEDEANFIIFTILDNVTEDMEEAKRIFNTYLKDE
jgi:hypothetical protein